MNLKIEFSDYKTGLVDENGKNAWVFSNVESSNINIIMKFKKKYLKAVMEKLCPYKYQICPKFLTGIVFYALFDRFDEKMKSILYTTL